MKSLSVKLLYHTDAILEKYILKHGIRDGSEELINVNHLGTYLSCLARWQPILSKELRQYFVDAEMGNYPHKDIGIVEYLYNVLSFYT